MHKMKKFQVRRPGKSSSKSTDLRQQQTPLPQKSLSAIQPPKKVIKALYDYEVQDAANNPGFLSFQKGDFLHVIGRENDPDWYEACNPLHDTRGLVPVNFFQEIGKQMPKSSTLDQSVSRSSAGQHDSGYAEKASQRGSVNGQGVDGDGHSRTKSVARNNVAMIYGMVLFDFKAERPDELEARAGENIVVIAQSTPEWFVAKPITRLGGPGLIPVGFVEIRDTATGLPVENSQEAIAKAGIPKVEEWKKMAADYKASSIPLGRLDMHNQSLNQSMERLSVTSKDPVGRHSGYGSSANLQQDYNFSQMISPVRAKINGFIFRDADYWFNVEAVMEDGRSWNLERRYKDFYALQLNLMEQFPEAAGKDPRYPRTLPYMPGPLPWVTEKLTTDRREHLDNYVRQLLKIDASITNSQSVRMFFYRREYDMELQSQGDEDEIGYRSSAGSQSSAAPMPNSTHSSTGNLSFGGGNSGSAYLSSQRQQQVSSPFGGAKLPPTQQRVQSDLSSSNPGSLDAPPPLLRDNSGLTLASDQSRSSKNQPPLHATSSSISPFKVKVWFSDSTCVVVRLPPTFNHAELVTKLRDRWSLEPSVDKANAQNVNFHIEYRDEPTQAFYRIGNDEELNVARERNEKLTLRVYPLEVET